MTFGNLCKSISEFTKFDFQAASDKLDALISNLQQDEFLPLVSEIGTIPESIDHDSTEEKLFSKVSDSILARCFRELGLKSKVLRERSNSADVYAESNYHNYSLVADAKAFRLSRTAKNQKDFKVESMAHWKGDNDYSVLCCPYFQYPQKKSQIYGQALNQNISLFSWEYFSILLKFGIKETSENNIAILWNQSAIIGINTTFPEKDCSFISTQDKNLCNLLQIDEKEFRKNLENFKTNLVKRGDSEIDFWKQKIKKINEYTREKAIKELISSLKAE